MATNQEMFNELSQFSVGGKYTDKYGGTYEMANDGSLTYTKDGSLVGTYSPREAEEYRAKLIGMYQDPVISKAFRRGRYQTDIYGETSAPPSGVITERRKLSPLGEIETPYLGMQAPEGFQATEDQKELTAFQEAQRKRDLAGQIGIPIDPDASKSAIDKFAKADLVEEAAKSQAQQAKRAQALNIYGPGGAALILEGIAAAGEMSRIKNDPTREYARETIADIQRRQEEGTLGLSGQQMAEAYKNVTAPLRAGTRQAELEAQRVAASQQGIMSAADQERIARRGARELGQQAQQGLAYVDQAQRQAVGDEITKMEQMMQYEAKAEATRAQTLGKSLGAAGQIIGTIAARRPVSVPQYTAAIAQQAYKSEVNLSSKQMTDMANYLTTHPYATSEQIAAEMGKIGITKISPEFYQAVRRT